MKLVFVSSTFKDMQFERDMIYSYVIPLIDDKLQRYGESIYFCDLRWGISTTEMSEEESSQKVIKICLDAIDDCKPYMIVLVGERYGWIPSKDLINSTAEYRNIAINNESTSVTELEIAYGALVNPDYEGRVLFYFRHLDTSEMNEDEKKVYEAESTLHHEKIEELKNKIKQIYPNHIRDYQCKWDKNLKRVVELEPLMELISHDLSNIIEQDILSFMDIPWQQRIMINSQHYFEEILKNHCSIFDNLPYRVINKDTLENDSDSYYILINGKTGSGKTHRLADCYQTLKEDDPFVYVFNNDENTYLVINFFKTLAYKCETILQLKHKPSLPDDDSYEYRWITYTAKLLKKLKKADLFLYIIIDNAPAILDNYLTMLELNLNPTLSINFCNKCNFKIMLAHDAKAIISPVLTPFFDYALVQLTEDLEKDQQELVIKAILKANHKELSSNVISYILTKEAAKNPQYLNMIISRLVMLDYQDFQNIRSLGDGMEAIDKYLISIVNVTSDHMGLLASEIIKEVAERTVYDFTYRLIGLLVYSSLGMNIENCQDFFKYAGYEFTSLNFALVTKNLKSILIERTSNHYYSIRNEEIANTLLNVLKDNNFIYVAQKLIEYELQSNDIDLYSNAFMTSLLIDDLETASEIYDMYYHDQRKDYRIKGLAKASETLEQLIIKGEAEKIAHFVVSYTLKHLDKHEIDLFNCFQMQYSNYYNCDSFVNFFLDVHDGLVEAGEKNPKLYDDKNFYGMMTLSYFRYCRLVLDDKLDEVNKYVAKNHPFMTDEYVTEDVIIENNFLLLLLINKINHAPTRFNLFRKEFGIKPLDKFKLSSKYKGVKKEYYKTFFLLKVCVEILELYLYCFDCNDNMDHFDYLNKINDIPLFTLFDNEEISPFIIDEDYTYYAKMNCLQNSDLKEQLDAIFSSKILSRKINIPLMILECQVLYDDLYEKIQTMDEYDVTDIYRGRDRNIIRFKQIIARYEIVLYSEEYSFYNQYLIEILEKVYFYHDSQYEYNNISTSYGKDILYFIDNYLYSLKYHYRGIYNVYEILLYLYSTVYEHQDEAVIDKIEMILTYIEDENKDSNIVKAMIYILRSILNKEMLTEASEYLNNAKDQNELPEYSHEIYVYLDSLIQALINSDKEEG